MAEHEEIITSRTSPEATPHAFWGAIIAGVVMVIVVEIILGLAGLWVGLGSIHPATESNPLSGVGTGAIVWSIVSILLALYLGGWTAGRLAGAAGRVEGLMHGILTWATSTIIIVLLLTTTVGVIVGGTMKALYAGLKTTAQTVASGVGTAAAQNGEKLSWQDIQGEISQMLNQTGKAELQPQNLQQKANDMGQQAQQAAGQAAQNPQAASQELSSAVQRMVKSGKQAGSQVDRDAVVNLLVNRYNMSREDAEKSADRWMSSYQQTAANVQQGIETLKEKAPQVAEAATGTASKAAGWSFLGLLLGGISAGMGGLAAGGRQLSVRYEGTGHEIGPIVRQK